MQPRPGLSARLPDHAAKRAARVLERHHKKPRAAIASADRVARQRPLAVIDLGLLGGAKLQPVEGLRRFRLQVPAEALDGVVAVAKAEAVDQVLVDRHGIAPETHLRLDPGAMILAG